MNWVIWEQVNGRLTSRAHAAENFYNGARTYCGRVVGNENQPAHSSVPRCHFCQRALEAKQNFPSEQ